MTPFRKASTKAFLIGGGACLLFILALTYGPGMVRAVFG